MHERITPGSEQATPRVEVSENTDLASAQEKFPHSKLVKLAASLEPGDIEMLDYAFNRIGGNFSGFGIIEEDNDQEEIEAIKTLLATFAEEKNYDKKRLLAKEIATRVD